MLLTSRVSRSTAVSELPTALQATPWPSAIWVGAPCLSTVPILDQKLAPVRVPTVTAAPGMTETLPDQLLRPAAFTDRIRTAYVERFSKPLKRNCTVPGPATACSDTTLPPEASVASTRTWLTSPRSGVAPRSASIVIQPSPRPVRRIVGSGGAPAERGVTRVSAAAPSPAALTARRVKRTSVSLGRPSAE